MNTQDLLLNAAKAMGLLVIGVYDDRVYIRVSGFSCEWNPLTNAAQLNEMRAKLGICTDWYLTGQTTPHVICYGGNSRMAEEDIEDHPTRQAAEAMAALRVAAQIGEGL